MIAATVTTVTTTPTLLLTASRGYASYRQHVTVRNNSSLTDVHLGPAGVTAATGLILGPAQSLSFPLSGVDQLYAITPSGTAPVSIFTTT